jgi:hypothetical protein
MQSKVDTSQQKHRKERLALIKERYKKVVLAPKRELDKQFTDAFSEDLEFDLN